jgi:Tfp pilus assembly protein PilO
MESSYTQNAPKRFYLVSFLLFLAAMLGAYFYVVPLWNDVTSLSLGRDDKASQKKELQTTLTDLQLVQQSLNASTEVSKETSLAAIPERLEEDKLIAELVKIVRDNNVYMGGISFSIPAESAPGEIAKAGINVNLTGTEGELINFLGGIEASSRKIVVNSISVQKASTESGKDQANFNLSMETYFQGEI